MKKLIMCDVSGCGTKVGCISFENKITFCHNCFVTKAECNKFIKANKPTITLESCVDHYRPR